MSQQTPAAFEPLVSVVMPVYNRAPLVGRAIASVLAQSYRRFEIIVVDDASTDGLAAALADMADPRLRCIAHPRNRGAAAARNTGIAAAQGEFVAFLDSDDGWYPEKLAYQVAAMRNQPNAVAGHVCAYDRVKAGYKPRRFVPNWLDQPFSRAVLFGCTCGPGTTLLCRRDVYADVGPLDEELRRLEDWDWLLRLAEKGYRLLASARALARVEVETLPRRGEIDTALQRIAARHRAEIARQGGAAGRIFAASLHLEQAASAFGERAYAQALGEVARGIACYPLQGRAFYRRLAEHAAGSVSRVMRGAG